ncbi:MAG: nucleotide exchange factor GrpE [Verrucomicrobiota bacterium]
MQHRAHRPPPPAATGETTPTAEDTLRNELAAQQDLYLRLAADFENFKRRTRQDGEARAAAQKTSLILELLPVIDNLERALASGAAPGSPQIHQGVAMTLQQLRLLLNQHGIISEDIVGHAFDPRQHEAIAQRNDPAHADHAILEVFQRGYRQGDTLLRPARVVVNDLSHPMPAPSQPTPTSKPPLC